MTYSMLKYRERQSKASGIAKIFLLITIISILTLFSKEISRSVADAIRLCALSLVPTLMPYLIISDYIGKSSDMFSDGVASIFFKKLFHINGVALGAFICGNICGFPIGADIAAKLYTTDKITKSECEHLLAIANNPSLAFVISAVGISMRGSLYDGMIIYFSLLISTIVVGIIFRAKDQNIAKSTVKSEQKFILANSIRQSGIASIGISSYVIFFSALIATIKIIIKWKPAVAILTALLEVTNACVAISSSSFAHTNIGLAATAFVLAFSGISVHMQTRSLLPREVSMRTYYKMKLLQSLLAALISFTVAVIV